MQTFSGKKDEVGTQRPQRDTEEHEDLLCGLASGKEICCVAVYWGCLKIMNLKF